jgi:hypothetical protein
MTDGRDQPPDFRPRFGWSGCLGWILGILGFIVLAVVVLFALVAYTCGKH